MDKSPWELFREAVVDAQRQIAEYEFKRREAEKRRATLIDTFVENFCPIKPGDVFSRGIKIKTLSGELKEVLPPRAAVVESIIPLRFDTTGITLKVNLVFAEPCGASGVTEFCWLLPDGSLKDFDMTKEIENESR